MPKKLVFGQTSLTPPSQPVAASAPARMAFDSNKKVEAPKPAAPSTPKAMSFGGQPVGDLAPLVAECKLQDPLIDKNPMFMPRLRACIGLKPLQWMNWANDRMEILRKAAAVQVEANVAFNDLKAAQWVDDAREHASKKPSLLDAFKTKIDPDWYDAQLVRVRGELDTLAHNVQQARDELKPKMLNLMLDNIIFQAVSKIHTDPAASQIAHSKIQTMISSVQMGQLAEQSLQNLLTTITTTIQSIDTVRSNVIPAWRIANSKR